MAGYFRVFFCGLCLLMAMAARAESLVIGGTGSALGTMRHLAQGFAETDAQARIEVLPSIGSGGAIKGLLAKRIALGVIARPLTDQEKSQGLVEVASARTPVVLVSSHRGELAFSTSQLVDLYSGRVARWQDGETVRLIMRPAVETDSKILSALSPEMSAAYASALLRPGMHVALTDQEAVDALESIPGSLGPTTLALLVSEKRTLQPLRLNGIAPQISGRANPDYPFYKPLYLVLRADAGALAQQFVRFIRSARGRAIIERNGYLNADK